MRSRRLRRAAVVSLPTTLLSAALLSTLPLRPVLSDEPAASSSRPVVIATLKTGEVLEGRLHRFVDGRYTIVASGRTWHFGEQEATSISFQKAAAVSQPRSSRYDSWTTAEPVEKFAHPPAGSSDRSYGDPSLIPVLASRGSEVIKPLMREVAGNSSLYQNAGKVFQLLGPDHFPAMLKELQAGTPGAEKPFYWALRQSGVRGVPVLRELLEHDNPKVRSFALYTLYNIGIQSGTVMPTSLTPVLLRTLNDPVLEVRSQAPAILAMVARPIDDIMPPLLAAVPAESERGDIGYQCVLALKSLGTKLREDDPWRVKIDKTMRECLSHPNSSIRSSAAYYFGTLPQPPPQATVEALRKAADDPEEYVRKTARETLYKFGIFPNRSADTARLTKAANSELAALIASEDAEAAANAIRVLKTREASAELLALLMKTVAEDHKSSYWNQVPPLLAAWNADQAAAWLEEYADSGSPLVRRVVAATYATMALSRLPDSLHSLASDPDMMVRSEAIRTLAKLASQAKGDVFQAAVRLLLDRIQDTTIHREYHWAACDALVEVGVSHPDVLPTIVRLAQRSPNAQLREAMIEALGEIGADLRDDSQPARQIVKTLASLLDEERSADLKVEVIHALSSMNSGSPVAADALRRALDDPRESISQAASDALRKLSGRARPGDSPEVPGDPP